MNLHNCINFLLSTSQNVVFRYLNEQLARYGITPSQYGVLNCLWEHGSLTPKQISEILCLEASSVSSILDRMQKNDLINRNIAPDNRRTIIVTPTQQGLDLQKPVEKIVNDMNEKVLEPFSDAQKEELLSALRTITQRKLRAIE